jgi:toxin YoeB
MNVSFTPQAWDEYLYWQRSSPQILTRIHELIKDIRRNPFTGIGKPEPLRHGLAELLVAPSHRRTSHRLQTIR